MEDHISGACTLAEKKLGRNFLFMVCRHHVMELIVGAAFEKTLENISTEPDIFLFKRFRDLLKRKPFCNLYCNNFQPACKNPAVKALVASCRADILEFYQVQKNVAQDRNDYREFLELAIIFIERIPARGIHFQVPGAMHRARWIAEVIYAIKIFLFRGQFQMTTAEKKREFVK